MDLWQFKVHVYYYTYIFVTPMWCVHLRILSMFFRPPEATQMNGSGKPGDTPQHVLQLALGILRSVSARPLGEEVIGGRVALVRKKMKRV